MTRDANSPDAPVRELKNVVTFDSSAREFVLGIFDKTVDSDGFVVEKAHPEQRVLTTPTSNPVRADNLAAVKKGSLLFFSADLPSIIDLSDRLE